MQHPRRQFLSHGLRSGGQLAGLVAASSTGSASLLGLASLPAPAQAATAPDSAQRLLALAHTHTGERLRLVYALGTQYLSAALGTLNRLLRDHYTGEVGQMDPRLFDLLNQVQRQLGAEQAFEVISGYRAPATNERLRRTRGGGVAQQSLHTHGRAIDVRLPGVPLADLRDAAWSLQAGGVGYYPRDGFVHIDTGAVRRW